MNERPLKLHLGSGEKYLEGYWNIDFPEGEHTVMMPRVDQYADIRTLAYPVNSIEEVRSHHLFEHFSRAEALKLLARWRGWLKPDGLLVIETPDFTTSASFFVWSPSLRRKFQLSRHIFGSQEAEWAMHKDYWDKRKYKFVLDAMGFRNIHIVRYWNGLSKHAERIPKVGRVIAKTPEWLYVPVLNVLGNLMPESFYRKFGSNKMPNILVKAHKDASVQLDEEAAARKILSYYLTGKEGEQLLEVWMRDFKNF